MSEWVIETFNVNFKIPEGLDTKDDLALQKFVRECMDQWFTELEKAGGQTVKDRQITAGLVEFKPGETEPGISGLEPVQMVQVSGDASFPAGDEPENDG